MKKIVLIFTTMLILAISSVCMAAADGGALNKDQKVADTFIQGITTTSVNYDKFSANFDAGLKSKLTADAYTALKNDVKTKLGDYKDAKFYSFERYDKQDKVTYVASFSKEEYVAMVFIFNKDGKLAEFGLVPMKKEQPQQQADQTAQK